MSIGQSMPDFADGVQQSQEDRDYWTLEERGFSKIVLLMYSQGNGILGSYDR